MYRAVTRMSQKVWELPFQSRMLASVHDELLMLAEDGRGEELREIMVEEMRQAWLDIFPGSETANLSESAVGQSWAAKPNYYILCSHSADHTIFRGFTDELKLDILTLLLRRPDHVHYRS